MGCFWTWQNGVFGVCFFEVLMLLCLVGVFGIVPEVLKMLVFFQFLGFCVWFILVYFGFGRFRCFCVSCVCFCFLCCFCFCFVCFVLICCWIVFWCWFLVCFCFCFFFFCFFVLVSFVFLFVLFFGGFKGQVRWPKSLGPKPSLLFGFCFFLFLLFFWRV